MIARTVVALALVAACGGTGQPTPTPSGAPTAAGTPPPTSPAASPTSTPTPSTSTAAPESATPTTGGSPSPSVEPSPSATAGLPEVLAWRELDAGAGPGAREDHTWTVDDGGGQAYLFGGRTAGDAHADLWRFDLAGGSWTLLEPSDPQPAPRFGHVAAWDGSGLVVWSGQRDATTFFADIWRYDPVANAWTQLPDAGDLPLARYGACGGVGPDGQLWVSHGFTADEGRFNDTRSYDLAAASWTDRTPSGDLPVNRCLHDCFWTAGGKLLLYAGQTTGVPALGDLWQYDSAAGTWAEQPEPPAPARQLYALTSVADQAFVFGGGDVDRGYLGDLWRLDVATLAWTELDAGAGPSARSGAAMVTDAARNRLLLFGGRDGDGEFGDMWELAATQ